MSDLIDAWDATPGGAATTTAPKSMVDVWDSVKTSSPESADPRPMTGNKGPNQRIASPGFDFVANQVSSLGSTIAGGYAGLYRGAKTLIKTGDKDKALADAVAAVEDTQKQGTFEPKTQVGQQMVDAFGSKYNPMQWPMLAAQAAGDSAGDALADRGMPVAGAVAKGLGAAAPLALGLKKVQGGLKNLKDMAGTLAAPIEGPATTAITSPLSGMLKAGEVPEAAPAAKPAYKLVNGKPALIPSEMPAAANVPSQYGSVGASGANVMSRIGAASENLKADAMAQIESAQAAHGDAWGDHVHWEALDKQLHADSLPVPGFLTEGQARGDPALISQEWNNRSKNGMMPTFDGQNKIMADNLEHLRREATPDVYGNTSAEHAETVIKAYQDLHAQETGSIKSKWDAIRKTSSDKMIFDADAMLTKAEESLKENKLTTHDPDGQLTELRNSAKSGGMNADQYVNWRQNLGRVAMKGGNEGKAASVMLKASNAAELMPEAEQYRGAVNEALAEGRTLHIKLKNDPAYKSVADGKASVDNFIKTNLVNSTVEKVTKMRDNLAHDDVTQQTLSAALLDHLREGAGLDDKYKGTFAADSFKKRVNSIATKGGVVFKNGELKVLGDLSEYAADAKFNAPSGYKNFSNTNTAEIANTGNAAMSKLSDMAGHAAEGVLAAKTGGLSSFVTAPLRALAKTRDAEKAAIQEQQNRADYLHKVTRPAAGLIK